MSLRRSMRNRNFGSITKFCVEKRSKLLNKRKSRLADRPKVSKSETAQRSRLHCSDATLEILIWITEKETVQLSSQHCDCVFCVDVVILWEDRCKVERIDVSSNELKGRKKNCGSSEGERERSTRNCDIELECCVNRSIEGVAVITEFEVCLTLRCGEKCRGLGDEKNVKVDCIAEFEGELVVTIGVKVERESEKVMVKTIEDGKGKSVKLI
jgi:hypothetical protein